MFFLFFFRDQPIRTAWDISILFVLSFAPNPLYIVVLTLDGTTDMLSLSFYQFSYFFFLLCSDGFPVLARFGLFGDKYALLLIDWKLDCFLMKGVLSRV
jgi:hypothetical protein